MKKASKFIQKLFGSEKASRENRLMNRMKVIVKVLGSQVKSFFICIVKYRFISLLFAAKK